MYKSNKYFRHTCHKTDPNADGYTGVKKTIECRGHLQIMMNEIDNTPGRGGVYNSTKDLIETYLIHWLGKEEFNKIKGKNDSFKSN